MNRVSASALDLMASALAAIMLLYIVTLQEILLFPRSLEEKSSVLIHLSMNKAEEGKCKIGVFLEKGNDSFFPKNRSDETMIEPRNFGATEYKVRLSIQKGQPQYDALVVVLHTCEEKEPKSQRLSIDILGSIATPRFQVILSPHELFRRLDLQKIKEGQTQGAWLPYTSLR